MGLACWQATRPQRSVRSEQPEGATTHMYELAFVVEQVLGHITHGDNLRRHVPDDPEVRPHWVFAPYDTDGWAARPRRRGP